MLKPKELPFQLLWESLRKMSQKSKNALKVGGHCAFFQDIFINVQDVRWSLHTNMKEGSSKNRGRKRRQILIRPQHVIVLPPSNKLSSYLKKNNFAWILSMITGMSNYPTLPKWVGKRIRMYNKLHIVKYDLYDGSE